MSPARSAFRHRLPSRLLAAWLALAAAAVGAEEPAEAEARLQALRAQIDSLQQRLNAARGQRDAVREELAAIERRLGALHTAVRGTERKLAGESRRLERLRSQARAQRDALETEQRELERALRTAYAMGRQEYLKLLLSQEDPARVARMTVYYRYLHAARTERIRGIERRLAKLVQLQSDIETQTRELAALREHQQRQKSEFEAVRNRRTTLLASLDREVRDRGREIERLRADERRLEDLLAELKGLLPALPPVPEPGVRFAARRGRLPLPARGAIHARYNEPKNIGDLRWRGLFLAAREGSDVIAVHRGRVAYADWLRGFGLLLILDHGDGYMTLYGHNQSLTKQVGDWVEAGETVASVGSTGDPPRPGVYFEIRHNGEPSDPLRWCVARAR